MSFDNKFSILLNSNAIKKTPFPDIVAINLTKGTLFLDKETRCVEAVTNKGTAYFIGNLYNRVFLINIAYTWNHYACQLNDAELLITLQERFGDNIFSLCEGNYCLIFDTKDSQLRIVTEPQGINAIHRVDARNAWITNSLKSISEAEGNAALVYEMEDKVIRNFHKSDTFTPVLNSSRLKPGSVVELTPGKYKYEITGKAESFEKEGKKINQIPSDILLNLINDYLNYPLREISGQCDSVSIPLSGGLDSSLIAALAKNHFKNIIAFSIGTEDSDEFVYSELVADALMIQHEKRTLSEQEIIQGIIEAVYHNEIFDGLSAEIQSGLFNVYKMASSKASTMITGYGSDLLFGGIIDAEKKHNDINYTLQRHIYRTRWTNEFATHGAYHYGIDIRHPFWTQPLITLCHKMDIKHKVHNKEVKKILKKYAENLHLLPEIIIKRKKLGIHEGSAVNKSFASILGVETENYTKKNLFCYRLFKNFISQTDIPEDITKKRLIEIMNGKSL